MLLETERLIIKNLEDSDLSDLFELDSCSEVYKFFDNQTSKTIEESKVWLDWIKNQYILKGIEVCAVFRKEDFCFIGLCGLRIKTDLFSDNQERYELVYRFMKKHWGKGYATEASKAWISYAVETLKIKHVFAEIDPENSNSIAVAEKLGMKKLEELSKGGLFLYCIKLP
jgi:ribosomal-protein-alanine N-acetyltransferase